MKAWCIALAGVVCSAFAAANPSLTNLDAEQQVATKDLVISYDIADGGSNQVWISAELFEGGTNLQAKSFSGDIGIVTPGNGKSARWLAGEDWNEQLGLVDVQLVVQDGAVIVTTNPVSSFPCSLPKSGAVASYRTGDDFNAAAGVDWPNPRFTIHDNTLHGYFTDNLTGLMWQRYAYSNATWSTAMDRAESMVLGEYDDWRIPNINELLSLFSFGNVNPSATAPLSSWNAGRYWSSTTKSDQSSYAATLSLYAGELFYNSKSSGTLYLAVRGDSSTGTVSLAQTGQSTSYYAGDDGSYQSGTEWPTNRFVDNGDNTVTDHLYGLMWSKNPLLGGGWFTCLDVCNSSTFAGYDNWRMPNVQEMMSLLDMSSANQIPSGWPGYTSLTSYFWTSTSFKDNTTAAWAIHYGNTSYAALGYYSKGNSMPCFAVRTATSEVPDPVATIPFSKTGQLTSYAGGDDGALQKGSWQAFAASYSAYQNHVVDPITGLMWTLYPQIFSGTWEEALAYCNDLTLDGYSDWRMPNLNEMMAIVHYGRYNPAFHAPSLAGNVFAASYYWTGTTSAQNTNQAWSVHMSTGYNYPVSKDSVYYVFPVRQSTSKLPKTGQAISYLSGDDGTYQRGTAEPYAAEDRFVDHANGTITDRRTDLMWFQSARPAAATNWTAALAFCNDMTYGGYTDWRLPNVRELASLFDYGNASSALPSAFPLMNVQTNLGYWTSTTYAGGTDRAWILLLEDAIPLITTKTWDNYFLPVRDAVRP